MVLRLLASSALVAAAITVVAGSQTRIVKNGTIPLTEDLGFRFEDLKHSALDDLAKREQLVKRAGKGPRQFDQIVELRKWVASEWKAIPGPRHRVHAQMFLQSLAALGHTARFVELGSRENPTVHLAVEVWSNDFNKWAVMDADYNLHFERRGQPMSALEVHDAFVSVRLSEVYLRSEPLRRGETNPRSGPHGTADFYHFVRFHLKADQLSKPDEPPFDRQNDMVEWLDRRVLPWELGTAPSDVPREPLTRRKTENRAAVEFPLNQVQVTAAGDEGALTLTLRHNVRQFLRYEYRVLNERGQGEWRPHAEDTLRVQLSPVARRIEVRGVNVRGVAGPPAVVALGSDEGQTRVKHQLEIAR